VEVNAMDEVGMDISRGTEGKKGGIEEGVTLVVLVIQAGISEGSITRGAIPGLLGASPMRRGKVH
jgi:hypothetical protein